MKACEGVDAWLHLFLTFPLQYGIRKFKLLTVSGMEFTHKFV